MKYYKPFVDALANIQRSSVVEGKTVPALINSRSNDSYRFLNLELYADGAVDYGSDELIDLKLFLQKLEQGWITTQVPDGEIIVAGRLGELKVSKGRWIYDSKAFYKYVLSIFQKLNPTNQNLFTNKGEKYSDIRLHPNTYSSLYREDEEDRRYQRYRIEGKMMHAFYRSEVGVVNLVNLFIFSDRKVIISGLAGSITIDMDGLEKFVEQHKIISEFPPNTEVTIYGLGSFIAEQVEPVPVKELLLEAYKVYTTLVRSRRNEQCVQAYYDYKLTPNIVSRENLRQAYEDLGYYELEELSHRTDYCHISIRLILYGDQEFEKRPRFGFSTENGMEIKSLVIPNPVDE